MAFLTKIRNSLKKRKNKSFRESVQEEKNQKYLIKDRIETTKRGNWNPFRKEGNRLSPFSRFIQEKIHITQDFSKRQQLYLKSIGTFLILASSYILIYSPYFLLSPSKVLIEALDDGIDISIAYRAIEDLYGKNIFMIDERSIANSIKSYQKNISLVRIDTLYPNNIKILLSAFPVAFTADIGGIEGKKWGMTENGILIPHDDIISKSENTDHLHIIDNSITEDDLLDYKEIMSSERALVIKKMISTFYTTWPAFSLQKISYLKKENEIHILLKNQTTILFTLQDFTRKTGEALSYKQLTLQFITLQTFIENHQNDLSNGVYTYIDARIPGRIFSCRERSLCERNLTFIYPER